MALVDNVIGVLRDAGSTVRADMWRPGDDAFLKARAEDLVKLNQQAEQETDFNRKSAYVAAAKDTVEQVKLLMHERVDATSHDVIAKIAKCFVQDVLPRLIELLPALIALL